MTPSNPQAIELLAQRYVLGTMRGRARRRFAAYASAHFPVRRAVDDWQARLAPLAWSVPPVTPSDLVWQRVRAALGHSGEIKAGRRASPWAALAAALGVIAVIAGGGWWQAVNQPPVTVTETVVQRVPEQVTVALINDAAGEPLWFSSVREQAGELRVRVINPPEVRAGKDYQLWLLTEDGTPLSLGLLPVTGERQLPVSAAVLAALDSSEVVAVSLEPEGGSPEPVPTGPVLFTAALLSP